MFKHPPDRKHPLRKKHPWDKNAPRAGGRRKLHIPRCGLSSASPRRSVGDELLTVPALAQRTYVDHHDAHLDIDGFRMRGVSAAIWCVVSSSTTSLYASS
jgi:hypothetical protein